MVIEKRFAVGTTLAAAAAMTLGGTAAQAESIFALEDVGTSQQLSVFDSATPSNVTGRVSITGVNAGESLLGIDFRPATGTLYALSSGDALYTIDTTTGSASRVGDGFTDSPFGTFFGFDFNPALDAIRIVSAADTNFVANPDSGDANVADTTPLFYEAGDVNEGADPNIVGSAYTNSVFSANLPATTEQYGIDTDLDILTETGNNAGNLSTVGSLGVDLIDIGEFDISGATGVAYVAGIPVGETNSVLYTVNLETGLATSLGFIGGAGDGQTIVGISVGPGGANVIPTPAALPAGLALLGFVFGRRRRQDTEA